ncbi:uncharacterized protein G2W53_028105 [Senna tora]|uniref:Uncharacterized protein n=1 Tax=Senna tora TaxID=362788 RepID=A0A834T2J8_9FABA|nr:uncharacterized protein G2W53_028105 [Senna tora]
MSIAISSSCYNGLQSIVDSDEEQQIIFFLNSWLPSFDGCAEFIFFGQLLANEAATADEFIGIRCEAHMQIINDGKVYEGDGCSRDDDEEYVNLVNAVVESNLYFELGTEYLTSDHVFLWWDSEFFTQIYDRIEESRDTSDPKISLELNFHGYLQDSKKQRQYIEIKECGIYPVDDEEYQNLITSASGMGVGCSYQNNDEEEAQPPMKKSKH